MDLARRRNAPLQIQMRVAIQVNVIQKRRHMWIQSRERPFSVATREEMDALVMDFGGTSVSENCTWMGKRMGNVVSVWRRAHQTAYC